MIETFRTIILGAGAAGLFAAARSGPDTLVLDHAKKPAEKVRISGGGRCNFTNLDVTPDNYLCENKHFHKSALSRFTQWDFLELFTSHGLSWTDKGRGQLFCDQKSGAVIDMLLAEVRGAGAEVRLSTPVTKVTHQGAQFQLDTPGGRLACDNLVIATGGKSIPRMGATGFAYEIAAQFGHRVTETRPALVPLTFGDRFAPLSGVALPARASNARAGFTDDILFTHRGLSGPAVLQLSSYWREGEVISLDLAPGLDLAAALAAQRQKQGRHALTTELGRHLPARLVGFLADELGLAGNLADQSDKRLAEIAGALQHWELTPTGSEGYRTAEVTLGGVSTEAISSKTMESQKVPGLYFIGEALDVTGWLGGYNFQWAWASAAAAAGALRG